MSIHAHFFYYGFEAELSLPIKAPLSGNPSVAVEPDTEILMGLSIGEEDVCVCVVRYNGEVIYHSPVVSGYPRGAYLVLPDLAEGKGMDVLILRPTNRFWRVQKWLSGLGLWRVEADGPVFEVRTKSWQRDGSPTRVFANQALAVGEYLLSRRRLPIELEKHVAGEIPIYPAYGGGDC